MVDGADPTPDVVGTAARVARLAILPFVAFYAAFDAIVGFATGLLIHQANGLSGAEQAAAAQQIRGGLRPLPATPHRQAVAETLDWFRRHAG